MKISELTKAEVSSPDMMVPVELYGQTMRIAMGQLEGMDGRTPYVVEVYSNTGTVIKNGEGSTQLHARVLHEGTVVEDSSTAQKQFTYTWTKYDAGGRETAWEGSSSSRRRGNPVTVTASEVKGRATFRCEVTREE